MQKGFSKRRLRENKNKLRTSPASRQEKKTEKDQRSIETRKKNEDQRSIEAERRDQVRSLHVLAEITVLCAKCLPFGVSDQGERGSGRLEYGD